MGNSIFEKQILVNSGEYDRAKRLIENTYTGTEEDMSEYEDLAKQREIKRRTFLVLAAALPVQEGGYENEKQRKDMLFIKDKGRYSKSSSAPGHRNMIQL